MRISSIWSNVIKSAGVKRDEYVCLPGDERKTPVRPVQLASEVLEKLILSYGRFGTGQHIAGFSFV